MERRRFDIILAGVAFWLMDLFNELVNSAIFHVSDRAPLWAVTGDTSYLILIGLTIEISVLFAVAGVIFVKQLPPDPSLRILGIPNRVFLVLAFSASAWSSSSSSSPPATSTGTTGGGTRRSCR